VTLQVTPEQAKKLVLAANEGKLQLVMRNYSDQEDTTNPGVRIKLQDGGFPCEFLRISFIARRTPASLQGAPAELRRSSVASGTPISRPVLTS
jgi:Flp pilus assembly protein CpaB